MSSFGQPDSSVEKTVVTRLATYLCRMGSNRASGMLAKILIGEKKINIKHCGMYVIRLSVVGGFTEYFPASQLGTTLAFPHLSVNQNASLEAKLLDLMLIP